MLQEKSEHVFRIGLSLNHMKTLIGELIEQWPPYFLKPIDASVVHQHKRSRMEWMAVQGAHPAHAGRPNVRENTI